MIEQPVTRVTRDAEKFVIGRGEKDMHPDRQRGMWSFLTWSFFLAQALAANEVFAKGHGGDLDEPGASDASSADAAAAKAAALYGALTGLTGPDIDPAALAQFTAAMAALGLNPNALSAAGADPVVLKALMDALAAEGGSVGYVDGAQAAADGTDPGSHVPGTDDPGSHVPGDGVIPGLPGIDLPGIIPGIVDIPLDIIDHLGMTIPDLVFNQILDPVLATVGSLLETTVDTLGSITGSVLPVVADIVGDTIHLVEAPIQTVVAILDDVSSVVSSTTSSLTGAVTETADALTHTATDVVQAVATTATDTVEYTVGTATGVADDVLASGGQAIESTVGVVSAVTSSVLSSGGTYNDYDQQMATTGPSTEIGDTITTTTAGVESAVTDVVDGVHDVTQDATHLASSILNLGNMGHDWS